MSSIPDSLNVVVFGATSAIALATSRIYAARGASLYLVARNQERLSVAAADAQVWGATNVYTRTLDLDDTDAHASLLDDVTEKFPRLDIALVAHGVLGDQARAQQDFAVAKAILHTNLLSVVSLVTLLANHFEKSKAGTIAVISSVAGDRGRMSNYVYGTSKAALTVFLGGLRNRLNKQCVHVLTIKPGFVASPMTAHLKHGVFSVSPQRIAQGIVSAIDRKKDVVYLPWFWRPIMRILRGIPEGIFKRMNL